MNPLDRLLELLVSPAGIAGLVSIPIVIFLASTGAIWRSRLAGLVLFLSGLGKFQSPWEEAGPLITGLNELRDYGRYLALGLAVFLSIVLISIKPRLPKFAPAIVCYLVVQFIITISYGVVGNWFSALLQFPFALSSCLLVVLILEEDSRENSLILREMLLVAGSLFLATTFIQFAINRAPLFLENGLFTGLTGNPQHAAVFLGIIVVASSSFAVSRIKRLDRLVFSSMAAGAFFLLILSGSRTGLAMTIIGGLAYLAPTSNKLIPILLSVILIGGTLYFSGAASVMQESEGVSKLTSGDMTTRREVWGYQVRSFLRSPIFGAPFPAEGRHRFGESSWFGAASAMGLMGLIPMLIGAFLSLKSLRQLMQMPPEIRDRWQAGLICSGAAMVFAGSLTEAYLLGVITVPVLWLVMLLQMSSLANHYGIAEWEEEFEEYDEDLEEEFDPQASSIRTETAG